MWPSILSQSKAAGIDLIETYIFWNLHEPTPGQYYFEGNANITAFLDECQRQGLYVNLRIGPYVCAEWNYGGFPTWLRNVPGIVFRDYNEPFMNYMSAWMTFVVTYLKPYFASNGGPIIMAQVENEYGWLENEYGASGKQYAEWAANFANSLDIGVPWIMCSQDDIGNVINTCNGFYCHDWIANHWQTWYNQPAFWTENWPGWFQNWGTGVPHRPVQDVLYSAARWFAYGGSHMNYYMWHGGTTFGRWTGGPFIVTSYDYDVALDEYGYPYEPKYSLSSMFHNVIHEYQHIILGQNPPAPISLGTNVEISYYATTSESFSFLTNSDSSNVKNVTWGGNSYIVQPWSVQLLYNNITVFDTSVIPSAIKPSRKSFVGAGEWSDVSISSWTEPLTFNTFTNVSTAPLEQINVTKDTTDYLWYITKINVDEVGATVKFTNINDMYHMFVDGIFVGTGFGGGSSMTLNESIPVGSHQLQILCMTVGLENYGAHMEQYVVGLLGSVTLNGVDITNNGWYMRAALEGEILELFNPANSGSVTWDSLPAAGGSLPPLTWYKFNFNLQLTNTSSFALYMDGMTKGMIYANGNHCGRYWLVEAQGCTGCNYQGGYTDTDCRGGCGQPSQVYYHIPNDWLNNGSNEILVLEEVGGNPLDIQLVQRSTPYNYE
ncbi:hypothetical protein SAMD00019534_111670 [Acytostelium subglobosum LB1]|uniref:hypothetical protein n=1 Tax=Acytostelium subglobosum LB1 TaxID=1410327 RepID=UPI000644E685|nr:hypothetical protein SAMD00019534_111670 [Acytostelium subglobosum LB1]GAM27991.1 hypothetical protein SAMD00019534_111670 [Acytostelium subglobosum LB1]|eukprot:XP_012748950.1 hypothetical protein SAMD00019534_111670 [Acytostelium subglobosum LB1]